VLLRLWIRNLDQIPGAEPGDSIRTGPAMAISRAAPGDGTTDAGAWGTGASWRLNSTRASRALTSASARSSMVLIDAQKRRRTARSAGRRNRRPPTPRNSGRDMRRVAALSLRGPAAIAASTSSTIGRVTSRILALHLLSIWLIELNRSDLNVSVKLQRIRAASEIASQAANARRTPAMSEFANERS